MEGQGCRPTAHVAIKSMGRKMSASSVATSQSLEVKRRDKFNIAQVHFEVRNYSALLLFSDEILERMT